MDIARILRSPEGKTIEFKRDDSSHAPILRTVCAFANTAGGTIVLGVEDRTGTVLGIEDPLDCEERLASIIADGISPHVLPDIDIVAWRDTQLIAVRVHPGSSRPYHLKSLGESGGVYVRVGSTNRKADSALIAELARTSRGESFDEQPVPDTTKNDIDLAAVRSAFAGLRDIQPRDLATLRLMTSLQGKKVATVAGVLLFGSERLSHFPDAWIQVGRFKGTTKAKVLDSADIRSYPVEAVGHALAFVARNTSLGYEIHGARRIEVPEYPPEAVREALINAVVHADYSQTGSPIKIAIYDDRLEVDSPGLLVPGLTIPDLLGGVSKVRNRAIARVFRELGLVEQWGSGIARMHEACHAAGLAPPLLEEVGTGFRVTLFAGGNEANVTDEVDEVALNALRAAEGLSTSEVAERIGRSPRATLTRLKRLVELGLVVELGSGPNDPQRRYYVAEDPARYGG